MVLSEESLDARGGHRPMCRLAGQCHIVERDYRPSRGRVQPWRPYKSEARWPFVGLHFAVKKGVPTVDIRAICGVMSHDAALFHIVE